MWLHARKVIVRLCVWSMAFVVKKESEGKCIWSCKAMMHAARQYKRRFMTKEMVTWSHVVP